MKSSFLLFALLAAAPLAAQPDSDWKAGEDSPAHDSDALYALSPEPIVLENDRVRLAFDRGTGAWLEFTDKQSGAKWQTDPTLAESFRMYVPTPERSYNPVLGRKNRLAAFYLGPDHRSVELIWNDLQSEYQGSLPITLDGTVRLDGAQAHFDLKVTNRSDRTVATLAWPILGSVVDPAVRGKMTAETQNYGGLSSVPVWNPGTQSMGYYGTNWPTRLVDGRFILLSRAGQGLYCGAHNPDALEMVKYLFEVHPGFEDSVGNAVPNQREISGHPVRLSLQVVHYSFLSPGETGAAAPVVLSPYAGDWHAGVDVYKDWLATWYHPLPEPDWAEGVHAWQQLQINSAEDDLRSRYADLPRRVADDAKHGISVLQLVGWNHGGQDRGNPSNDTDPRLGTTAELKAAIAKIQAGGVHVVLFGKYPWADMTTDWYRTELHKHMATDANGLIYSWTGYRYQTPEQFAAINARAFATGCPNDPEWRAILAKEFQKLIDLQPDGVLFDEAQHKHTSDYNLCFSPDHGHHVPATIWSGDILEAQMYRKMIRGSLGEKRFLFSGEEPEDVLGPYYSLSYFRISPGHIPADRYAFPYRPLMIAASGFNDREAVNRALLYRYIISYEPFNFKGDVADFPLTLAYGEKVDALRRRYQAYVWDAEFRDTLGAKVMADDEPYSEYAVYRRKDGKRAVVVINSRSENKLRATVTLSPAPEGPLTMATPESADPIPAPATLTLAPRSAVILMEP